MSTAMKIDQEGDQLGPGVYRHYKGGLYRFLFTATEEEKQRLVVVYLSLESGRIWTRPADSWVGCVKDEDGKTTRRFQRMIVQDDLGGL